MYKNEVFVRFIITSDTITPDEITKALNKFPTVSWEKGAPKNNHPSLTYKYNKWEIFIKAQDIYHTDILLNEFYLQLLPIQTSITSLKNVTKEISIVVYKKDIMPSITCNSKIISFLHCLDAGLDIDVIEVG